MSTRKLATLQEKILIPGNIGLTRHQMSTMDFDIYKYDEKL